MINVEIYTWFVAWGAINKEGGQVNGHLLREYPENYNELKIANDMIEMIAGEHPNVESKHIYFTAFHRLP